MTVSDLLKRLQELFVKLGPSRIAMMAGVAALVIGGVLAAGYFLTRPDTELLYGGLDGEDVGRIATVLQQSGIPFDISSDGTAVYAPRGQTAIARMRLAERGLPRGATSGYELFDKIGAIGLSSFMQSVTRVRALEGELSRTIETLHGVEGARVHIVLPQQASFRNAGEPASASVVIRGQMADSPHSAVAIRHLVAAAVPGLKVGGVTVIDTDGNLLASGADDDASGATHFIGLEKSVDDNLQRKIRQTLAPYLGAHDMQVSVVARLNADKRQTKEVIYNPDSRVERSIKIVRENASSQNASGQPAAGVAQTIPQGQTQASDARKSNEENQRREETTNYEISSRTVTTVSKGFVVEGLSVAVLVNKAAIITSLGDKKSDADVQARLADLRALISSAVGLRKERGDVLTLSAIDYPAESTAEQGEGSNWLNLLLDHGDGILRSATLLLVTLLLVTSARPAIRLVIERIAPLSNGSLSSATAGAIALPPGASPDSPVPAAGQPGEQDGSDFLEDLTDLERNSPQARLQQMVEFSEERAVAVLKQWVHQGGRA